MTEKNDVTATVLDAEERPDLYISIGVKLVGEEQWWLASNAASTQSNIRNNGIIVCIPGHATLRKQAEEREARDAELARLRSLEAAFLSLCTDNESPLPKRIMRLQEVHAAEIGALIEGTEGVDASAASCLPKSGT